MAMSEDVRLLSRDDEDVLSRVAPGVFDRAVRPEWAREFLGDPRHHIVVAIEGETVIGMVTAIHYVHPDKPPELWIDEVAVGVGHRRRGLGRRMLERMLEHGRELGCTGAWVLTERDNARAERLYAAAGGRPQTSIMYTFPL